MKVGDLVRVKNTIPGDGLELRELYHDRIVCLLIDIRLSGFWTDVLEGGLRRVIPTNRLELVSESR